MACGVLATGYSLRVALLTPTSVACAESSTAASSSKGVLYSSSPGLGIGCLQGGEEGLDLCFFIVGASLALLPTLPRNGEGDNTDRQSQSSLLQKVPMQFATRLDNVETSAIRELFKLLGKPGIISFAGGFPGQRHVRRRGHEGGRRHAR